MRPMRSALMLILAAPGMLAAPVSTSAQERVRAAQAGSPADARLAAAVDRVAAKALADKATAGFAVAVMRDGQIALARGYGMADLEHGVPVTERTVFKIGSITKEFTAVAILKLMEQGKLSLDDRLSKYVPSFPRGGELTLRQLLQHTTGIRNYTSLDSFWQVSPREFTTDEMIALIAGATPLYDFEPGTSWSYSNSGFFLLGVVIEKASGQRYAEFVKKTLVDPLGLMSIAVDDLGEIVPDRAEGYDKAPGSSTGFHNTTHISSSVAWAAGAVRANAVDLAKWHEALLGGRVLKRESLALMTAPGRVKDGRLASDARKPEPGETGPPSDYGFGIAASARKGHRSIGHGGAINGFNASVQTFPAERTTVVLLTNTGGGTRPLMSDLSDAVLTERPEQPSRR